MACLDFKSSGIRFCKEEINLVNKFFFFEQNYLKIRHIHQFIKSVLGFQQKHQYDTSKIKN
jgi:hypothetical protein